MAIKFNQPVKHGTQLFIPTVALGFDDPDAEPYFIKAGWAEATDDEPVLTYAQDIVSVDPETVFADGPSKGQRVLEAGE